MTTSRKLSVFAALVFVTLLSAGVASAQIPPDDFGVITCSSNAVTPLVRAEGIAELLGDIVLTCINTSPAGGSLVSHLEANVSVSLNVNVTNNLHPDPLTDAVLVINADNCTAPVALGGSGIGIGSVSCAGGVPAVDERFQDPQFGTLAAANRLEWNGIHFPIPNGPSEAFPAATECDTGIKDGFFVNRLGNLVSVCNPATTIVRITSMRGNASMLGVSDVGTIAFTQVQADLVITGESAISVDKNQFNIGAPLKGLIVDFDEDLVAAGLQCDESEEHGSFTINEGFPTAFKTLGVPTFTIGSNVQNEAGYHGSDTGGATQSTRFLLTFHNIPEGVRIGVEHDAANMVCAGEDDSDHLELDVMDCDVNGDDCTSATPIDDSDDCLDGAVEVDIDGGSGWIGYEVTDDWTIASEDCTIDVWACWTPDTENDLPAPGTGQLSVSFAPLSTVGTSTEDEEPRPRFLDGTGSDPENIVNVVKCSSTILFPFVTNQNSFDTGLVVSNTSEDWLGTDPQDGACEIHYHGGTTGGGAAPATDPTSIINAGEQLIWLLSSGNAAQDVDPAVEFQGYVIVVCDFQYGHGYAFITDGFGSVPTLAQGYLALVLELDDDGIRAVPEELDQ